MVSSTSIPSSSMACSVGDASTAATSRSHQQQEQENQQQECECDSVPESVDSPSSSSTSSSSTSTSSYNYDSNRDKGTAEKQPFTRRRLTTAVASSALCFIFLAVLYEESSAARGGLSRFWKSNRHAHVSVSGSGSGSGSRQKHDRIKSAMSETHSHHHHNNHDAAVERTLEGDDNNDGEDNENDDGNNDGDNQGNDGDDDQGNDNDNDNNDDQQEQNGGDDQAQGDDQQNDGYGYDGDDRGYGADDYFYDGFTDDYGNDVTYVDDFYAYEEDPKPPTLFPLSVRVLVGYSIAAMALTLGASGGIGGGGIVVPVFILIMGLQPKVAIPIGAATVLGGAIGSTVMNVARRHPLADRPIIDWDLVMVMEPLTLIGTLLGTKFHSLFSEKFLVVLLVLLLSFTAHSTLTKAMRMYDAEKRYIRHLKEAQGAAPPTGSPTKLQSLTWGPETGESSDEHSRFMDTEEKQQILILNPDYVTLRSEVVQAEKFTPRHKISAVVCIFSVFIFLNIMVGGGAFKSPWDITCGSVAFWVVEVIMIAFLIASAWAAQTYLVARHEIKEYVRFDYVHGDIKWDARSAIIYPAVFIAAGLFAGMFGIGGGIITVPIMLAMGVHPSVVSATSSAMILFTSFSSCTSYVVFGLLLEDYAVAGFTVGFFAAMLGQKLMKQARQAKSASGRDFERNSYIAFVIGGVVLVSAVLMTIQYVFMIVDEPDPDGGLCDGLQF
jgi:uncharacterized membrane protein YfcA